MIAAGVALLGVGALAGAAAASLPALALAQVPIGLGLAAVLVGAVAATVEWSPRERRTRVLSWTLVGQAVAWVAGMPVVGALAATAGWRPALSALPVASSAAALLALRSAPRGRAPVTPTGSSWVRRPAFVRWALGELLAFSAWTGTLVYAGALFATSYGLGPAPVGLALGAGAAAYLPGSFGARRWVDRSAANANGVLALAGAAVVLALFAVRPSWPVSAALFAVAAGVGGARTLAGSARGLELAVADPVSSTGVRAAAQQLGYLVGAALGSLGLEAGGLPALGLVLAALFTAAAATTLVSVSIERRVALVTPSA
jgi:DHA1 family inner membrane transport protein